MTYYEEFSIPASATPEEIRLAHRRLIKILHPDLQLDDAARVLAELQTRRVNCIARTLLDPVERHDYDLTLLAAPRVVRRKSFNGAAVAVAVALAIGCIAAVCWAVPDRTLKVSETTPAGEMPGNLPDERTRPSSRPEPRSQSPAPKSTLELEEPRGNIRRREPTQETKKSPGDRAIESTNTVLKPVATHAVPGSTASNPPHDAEPAQNQASASSPLIGTWIYVPTPLPEDGQNLYRPEYIELRIRDVMGVLEGQYRARYHVPDRPLSPNVGFRFTGQASAAAFRWNASNGVAGNVELQLTGANSVRVDWKVTEMAAVADLVSGTAILTRVQ